MDEQTKMIDHLHHPHFPPHPQGSLHDDDKDYDHNPSHDDDETQQDRYHVRQTMERRKKKKKKKKNEDDGENEHDDGENEDEYGEDEHGEDEDEDCPCRGHRPSSFIDSMMDVLAHAILDACASPDTFLPTVAGHYRDLLTKLPHVLAKRDARLASMAATFKIAQVLRRRKNIGKTVKPHSHGSSILSGGRLYGFQAKNDMWALQKHIRDT